MFSYSSLFRPLKTQRGKTIKWQMQVSTFTQTSHCFLLQYVPSLNIFYCFECEIKLNLFLRPIWTACSQHTVQSYITNVSSSYRGILPTGQNWRKMCTFYTNLDCVSHSGAFLNAQRMHKTILNHPLMLTTFTTLSVHKAYFRYRARPEERHRRTSATGHANMLTLPHQRKTINATEQIAPCG